MSARLKEQTDTLYDTEYDRYLQDQYSAMQYFYDLTERVLYDRLDDVENIIREVINYSNANADKISSTIKDAADSVGYDVSGELSSIWNGGPDAVSNYFHGWDSTSNKVVGTVDAIYQALKRYVDEGVSLDLPKGVLEQNKPSDYDGQDINIVNGPTAEDPNAKKDGTQLSVGDEFMATNAPIYATNQGGVGVNGTRQYFGSDPHYKVLKDDGEYVLASWYKLGDQPAGWFKKTDITPLASGGYTGSQEGLALIHKKERVLSPQQTESFERLVNDFLPKMGFVSKDPIKPASQLQTNVSSDIDLTFNLPNVTNSQDFIREMQQSREFEQLVQHIAYDPLSKKSTLRKNLVRIK